MKLQPRAILLGAIPFLVTIAVWTLVVRWGRIDTVFLPSIPDVLRAVWQMFVEEHVLGDVLVSCYRVILGFLMAVALATPLGLLMGYSARVSRVFAPAMGFMRYMPVPAFIPLCILWFGSGDLEKMIIIFLGAFFQLVLMIESDASSVRTEYYEAATMLGAPRRDLLLRVLIPASMPGVFDSYRICIGWAWTYLVVAEIVGASTGIGYVIIKAQRYLMVPHIFAGMLLIGLLGMATDLLFGVSGRWLFSWSERWSTST